MPIFIYTLKNNNDSHTPYFGDIIPKLFGYQYDEIRQGDDITILDNKII